MTASVIGDGFAMPPKPRVAGWRRPLPGLSPALLAVLLPRAATPAGAQGVPVAGLPGAALDARGGRTTLRLAGGPTVPLGRDGPCERCALDEARLVGGPPGAALVLVVTYLSRPGNPMAMCGAGTEEVLHVVSLRPRPREAVALRLSSCWSNMEADHPPSWDAEGGSLVAGRWTSASGGAPERRTWRIGRDGRVVAVAPPIPAR